MRKLIATLSVLLLSACGFQPMYSSSLTGGGPAIGNVQIGEIDGKAGHVLRTELTRLLSPEESAGPSSRLDITLREDTARLGIRLDESATRAELRLTANYVWTSPDGQQVMRGSLSQVAVYQIPDQAFGEIAAQDDARERAAETLAVRFRQELAMRMAQARYEAAHPQTVVQPVATETMPAPTATEAPAETAPPAPTP
ncbi:MAG: LPS assembly lipoprotein LptE [Hyphomonadaceae bacterium]|nr:LPS assembly lipoprotein LptE [Hyphomonadaceae bacterium]